MQIRLFALAAASFLALPAAQAQVKPRAVPAPISTTRTATPTKMHSPQPLDNLVKHLQTEGFTISRLHRELYPDGSLKHYSFDVMPSPKTMKALSSGKERPVVTPGSVDVNFSSDETAAKPGTQRPK